MTYEQAFSRIAIVCLIVLIVTLAAGRMTVTEGRNDNAAKLARWCIQNGYQARIRHDIGGGILRAECVGIAGDDDAED